MLRNARMNYRDPLAIVPMYRATGWSGNVERKGSKAQPYLFYQVGEVNAAFAELVERHAFEMRRAKAMEDFYLKELGYSPEKDSGLYEAADD